nr:MAG TPA: hypothetical protein [Caudoviricetes sp.]
MCSTYSGMRSFFLSILSILSETPVFSRVL